MVLAMMKLTLKSLIYIRLLTWHNKFEKRKALKKELSEELMPVPWHPRRWWDLYLSEDKKKEIEPLFTDKIGK